MSRRDTRATAKQATKTAPPPPPGPPKTSNANENPGEGEGEGEGEGGDLDIGDGGNGGGEDAVNGDVGAGANTMAADIGDLDEVTLQAPDEVTSISVEGTEYKVNKEGLVTVPSRLVLHLAERGFHNPT